MRIISLFPAATEMVCALGAASSLVGISHDSDFPPELLDRESRASRARRSMSNAAPAEIDRMVRVADTLGESLHVLDAEAIADLEPDVIITQGICDVCAIREGDVRIIAESLRRPPIVLALSADSLDEMLNDIHRVAAVIERSPISESLVERLESAAVARCTSGWLRPQSRDLAWRCSSGRIPSTTPDTGCRRWCGEPVESRCSPRPASARAR